MGGYLGFGGSGYNTDRREQLKGYGDLSNVFNFGFNQGKSNLSTGVNAEKQGLEELGGPEAYYQKLLTGNRASAMSAVAPTVNAINSQTDAATRQASAMGTARGGGANAPQQQIDTTKQAAVESAITGARSGAAQGESAVAGETAQIGSSLSQQALHLLGLAGTAAQDLTQDASASRSVSDEHNKMITQQYKDLIASAYGAYGDKLTGLFTGGKTPTTGGV